MTPVYSGDAVARVLYEVVLVAWLGSELWHGLRVFARRVRAGNGLGSFGQDRFSGPALILGIALAIGLGIRAAVFVPHAAITALRPEIFGVGLALALAGIALRGYAIAKLGRFFNTRVTVTSDQVVVDTGPRIGSRSRRRHWPSASDSRTAITCSAPSDSSPSSFRKAAA
ncbi:MAG: hypothetical protein E6I42_11560 [Chloroflexi bacterium]|nr:MAG: hypothetical protein E6I42_11560 [Chloroflexota bacterium]